MPDAPLSERALEAKEATRRLLYSLEIETESELEILRAENNVVFLVNDHTVAKAVEKSNDAALKKEASIIEALQHCEHVVKPSVSGIGPFEVENWTVILLQKLYPVSDAPSTPEIQESLMELHQAMSGLQLDLTNWLDQLKRTVDAWKLHPFQPDQQAVANDACDQFVSKAFAYDGPLQALHGDAWSGQVIKTAEGLRWIDFETASIGPKEWDLACFDVIDGYGDYAEALWRDLRLVRSWTVAVWSHINAQHSPQLIEHVDHHLARLSRCTEKRINDEEY